MIITTVQKHTGLDLVTSFGHDFSMKKKPKTLPETNMYSPWKSMVGRDVISFWDGLFSETMLVSGRVSPSCEALYFSFKYPRSFLSNLFAPPRLYPQVAPRILQFFFKILLERSVHNLIADLFADLPTIAAMLTHLGKKTHFSLRIILHDASGP